jgi:cobalt-zinc-cadmium efflux system membrane fusion protein
MKRAIFAAAAVALGLFACGEPDHEEYEDHGAGEPEAHAGAPDRNAVRVSDDMARDLRITTARVEERPEAESVDVPGELRVNDDAYAEIGAPIGARVVDPRASVGDRVAVGQELVVLESAELGDARSALRTADARVALMRQTLARRRELASERIVAAREVQESEAELHEAEAQRRAATARLEALGADPRGAGEEEVGDGGRLVLRSPVAGTVIERAAVRGQLADPAVPLYRVGDLSELWFVGHAFERDALRVRVGEVARIALPALPGEAFTGTVALVGREVEPASRTIAVRVVVRDGSGRLRPGMSATGSLPVGEAHARILSVPVASLQRLDDAWVVFVPRGETEFEVRRVGRGRDLGGEVEIVSGAAAGEAVVVEGAFLLKAEAEKARGEGEHHDH